MLCVGILLLTYHIPLFSHALAIQPLDNQSLILVVGAGLLPVGIIWLARQLVHK
ncbi:hypothetical protein [Spirosoma harenae]